jgi:hypothetical protein
MVKIIKQRKYPWAYIERLTAKEYREAFVALNRDGKITEDQREMLRVHCDAGTLTHNELARKAHIRGGYATVNNQYGRLAHLLWDVLALPPSPEPYGRAKWIGVLESGEFPPRGRQWQGTMHANVAKALKQIGWCGNKKGKGSFKEASPKATRGASRHTGAAFGDPQRNELVELAAVNAARNYYRSRGWRVESREKEPVHYDLLCTRGGNVRHVEVKGIAGAALSFIITASEKEKAAQDSRFRLLAVTSALHSSRRRLREFTSGQLLRKFRFEPLSFMAKLQPA